MTCCLKKLNAFPNIYRRYHLNFPTFTSAVIFAFTFIAILISLETSFP
jgi:hypothetical protein